MDAVTQVLSKFRRKDIPVLLERWKFAKSLSFRDLSGTKASIVKKIAELCLDCGIEEFELAEADIIRYQLSEGTKQWKVYEINYGQHESEERSRNFVPEQLENRFGDILDRFYSSLVVAMLHKDAIWFRVLIQECPSTPFFLVYYPNSTLLLTNAIKAKYKEFVLQAFMLTLGAEDLKPLQLTGRDSQSISDLVLNRKSQGEFSAFQLNQVDPNPLVKDFKTRRELQEGQECKSKIEKYIKQTFGENELPKIEKLHFEVEIPVGDGNSDTVAISMQASFSGPHVLDSIREMLRGGIMVAPLPDYLSKLPSMRKNNFSLVKR